MKFDAKKIKILKSGWRGSFEWKRKLLTEWLKQIKFLFIAICCPFVLHIHKSNVEENLSMEKKLYMPLPFEEKSTQKLVMRQYFIFFSFFISFWGWFLGFAAVCFLYPFIQEFYFISFLCAKNVFISIETERERENERDTCENVFYLSFIFFFLRVRNYYFSLPNNPPVRIKSFNIFISKK